MSWQESIKTPFKITTGDGKSYTALWRPTGYVIEYNVAEFNFPDVEGSLVRREQYKGSKHDVEFYFTGADHLITWKAFELSARDKNPWSVEHPYYGTLLVQPIGMTPDHSMANATRVSASWIETITEDAPLATSAPEDKILEDKSSIDELSADAYAADVAPKAADIKELGDTTKSTYDLGKKKLSDTIDSEKYFNAFTEAQAAINNAVADPLLAIRKIQAMVNAPFLFAENVRTRIDLLKSQLQNLANSIATIISRNSKKLFENNSSTMLGAMLAASVTNVTYTTRKEAVANIETILEQYNAFLLNLDTLQSQNGAVEDAYMPDAQTLVKLSQLVSFTVSSLLIIAADARQDRILILEEDTNIIPLASRLYGLKPDDSTIDELIEVNEIGLNELLIIKKGRTIIYYV